MISQVYIHYFYFFKFQLNTYETLFLNLQYLLFSLPYFLCSLKDYWEKHPEVTVLDPPAAIQHLYNRQSMLQDVANLNLSDCYGKCCHCLILIPFNKWVQCLVSVVFFFLSLLYTKVKLTLYLEAPLGSNKTVFIFIL